jgi:hypothetical protein
MFAVRTTREHPGSGDDEQVMYWRKANHVHAWFVHHVQNGDDDCGTYEVTPEKLAWLRNDCDSVIENSELVDGTIDAGTVYSKDHPDGVARRIPGKVIKDTTVARRLLPTCSGFFFGGTDYDQLYLEEVVRTRDWTVRMLADHDTGVRRRIFYSSSW